MLCGSACVDVMTDNDHCGGCNRPCNGTCTNGACVVMPGGTVLLPPSIRRMTNAEYDASVQALLGTTKTPSTKFPPDSRQLAGYTLNDAQRIDPVMAKALDDAALALVAEARTAQQARPRCAPCASPTAASAEACATTFINDVRREGVPAAAWRAAEIDGPGGAVPARRRQPRDVQRRHRPGHARDPAVGRVPLPHGARRARQQRHVHADAPRSWRRNLSYLVAGGPPDAALQNGDRRHARDADGRETQVRRLLGTQAGRDRMVRVVREWLGVDRITETAKDTTVYPRFTTAARTSIDTETKKFIDEVVQRSTGTVGELLSANWSIVDSTLAPIYGVTSAGATAHTNAAASASAS